MIHRHRPSRWLTSACAIGSLVLGVPAVTHAAEPADNYNFDGARHNLQCVALNKSAAALRDGAGVQLANLTVTNSSSTTCGGLRFQGMEMLVNGEGKDLYYSWGVGGQYGQSGHIWVYDLTARPSIDPDARGCTFLGGSKVCNGRAAPDLRLPDGNLKSYYIVPTPIPIEMHYYGVATNGLYHYENYGTPAAPYSSDHTPLVWSWVNKTGGGIVRAQMARGEVFYPSDVATITMASVDHNGNVNGSVKAMYGFFWNGYQRVYGWTVHSHIYNGTYYPHIQCRTC